MDILAWVIGVLFAIILFGIVVGGILVLIEWILDLKHNRI